jgi:hypothetical protein
MKKSKTDSVVCVLACLHTDTDDDGGGGGMYWSGRILLY